MDNKKLSKLLSKYTRIIDERPYESRMAFLGMIAGCAKSVDERVERLELNRATKNEKSPRL